MSAIKSIIIKGGPKQLTYRLCPNTEFSHGTWHLSVNTISYTCRDANFLSICSLRCNFVRGQKYALNEDTVLAYEMPIALFSLETGSRSINAGNIFFLRLKLIIGNKMLLVLLKLPSIGYGDAFKGQNSRQVFH